MNLTGPIAHFVSNDNGVWRFSLLMVCDAADPQPELRLYLPAELENGSQGPVPGLNATAWRFEIAVRQTSRAQSVAYRLGGRSHSVWVPAQGVTPTLAYVSCNGFSSERVRLSQKQPNALWAQMQRLHQGSTRVNNLRHGPLELLLMGGDQVYSDALWTALPELQAWAALDAFTRAHHPFSASLRSALQTHFARLYLERWNQPETAALLGSVPSVMMWDDHDIFDGWGSHPAELHHSPVYQGIFAVAREAFELFQRPGQRAARAATLPGQPAHHSGYRFGHTALLVLDTRSERQPRSEQAGPTGLITTQPAQVISEAGWSAIFQWLDAQLAQGGLKHLLLMSSVPLMHPGFAALEKLLGALPAIEELEDDLRDHWTSPPHRAARLRLVQRLLDASARGVRVTVLSGDVHVGSSGVIESSRTGLRPRAGSITQLTSSAVTHPPPTALARQFLEKACQPEDILAPDITGRMVEFAALRRKIIGSRNFLSLMPDPPGGADRLWAHWWIEGQAQPVGLAVAPVG